MYTSSSRSRLARAWIAWRCCAAFSSAGVGVTAALRTLTIDHAPGSSNLGGIDVAMPAASPPAAPAPTPTPASQPSTGVEGALGALTLNAASGSRAANRGASLNRRYAVPDGCTAPECIHCHIPMELKHSAQRSRGGIMSVCPNRSSCNYQRRCGRDVCKRLQTCRFRHSLIFLVCHAW